MLILTLHENESLLIGGAEVMVTSVAVRGMRIHGCQVKLGISAPIATKINRGRRNVRRSLPQRKA